MDRITNPSKYPSSFLQGTASEVKNSAFAAKVLYTRDDGGATLAELHELLSVDDKQKMVDWFKEIVGERFAHLTSGVETARKEGIRVAGAQLVKIIGDLKELTTSQIALIGEAIDKLEKLKDDGKLHLEPESRLKIAQVVLASFKSTAAAEKSNCRTTSRRAHAGFRSA